MERAFHDIDLKRIRGIDGMNFSNGRDDEDGKPQWCSTHLGCFLRSGIIHPSAIAGTPLYPSELGCAFSHVKCWKIFLASPSEYQYALVLEDDVEPTERLRGENLYDALAVIPEFDKADLFFPIAPSEPWRPIRLHRDGQVRGLRSHMAYVITRKAAEIQVRNVFPLVAPIDNHVGVRFIEGMRQTPAHRRLPGDLPKAPAVRAYGMRDNPLIRPHAPTSKKTTFTRNERKDWIPDKYKEDWVA